MSLDPPAPDLGIYGISVAAELSGVPAQTLRLYESKGLLEPHRTPGGTRRYSAHDLARVEQIQTLTSHGLNLNGIARILMLEAENCLLQAEIAALRDRQSRSSRSGSAR